MRQVMNQEYLDRHPELKAKVRKLAAGEGKRGNWYNTKFFQLLYCLPDEVRAAFQFVYRADHDIYNVIDFINWAKRRRENEQRM